MRRKFLAPIFAVASLLLLFLAYKNPESLPAQVDGIEFNDRIVEGILALNKSKSPNPENVTRKSVEDWLKDLIIMEHICNKEGIILSDEEIDSTKTLQYDTLDQIKKAAQSDNELERQNAQFVLDSYYQDIEASGLTQEEYEAVAVAQLIYYERKEKLTEIKFGGDAAKCENYLLKQRKKFNVAFHDPG